MTSTSNSRIVMRPTSPSDCHAPLWARWKAMDADGTWHWFECTPRYNRRIGKWTGKGECAEAAA